MFGKRSEVQEDEFTVSYLVVLSCPPLASRGLPPLARRASLAHLLARAPRPHCTARTRLLTIDLLRCRAAALANAPQLPDPPLRITTVNHVERKSLRQALRKHPCTPSPVLGTHDLGDGIHLDVARALVDCSGETQKARTRGERPNETGRRQQASSLRSFIPSSLEGVLAPILASQSQSQ